MSAWNLRPMDGPLCIHQTLAGERYRWGAQYALALQYLAGRAHLLCTSGADVQEVPGPLGMGSRGVDDHCTPQKERGAHAVHKGLLKFAHKVSPMRMAGRGARSPYHSPSKGF